VPNKRWNNMHGANDKSGGGAPSLPSGSPPSAPGAEKTVDWPGLPGQTQSKDRSAGQPKKGWKGEFYVKKVGL